MAQSETGYIKQQLQNCSEPKKTTKEMTPEERMDFMLRMSLKAAEDLELMLSALQAVQNNPPDQKL